MVSRDLQVGRFTIKKLLPTKVGSVICQRTDYNRPTSHTQQTLTQINPLLPNIYQVLGTSRFVIWETGYTLQGTLVPRPVRRYERK